MKPLPATYTVVVTIRRGEDEWWEEVAAIPSARGREKEVCAQIGRSLGYAGFHAPGTKSDMHPDPIVKPHKP